MANLLTAIVFGAALLTSCQAAAGDDGNSSQWPPWSPQWPGSRPKSTTPDLKNSPLLSDGRSCHPSPDVLCITKYASVMPYPFSRGKANVSYAMPFNLMSMPKDEGWSSVGSVSFLVFDKVRAREVLGNWPDLQLMFVVSPAIHEAPVYMPETNRIFLSEFQKGQWDQMVIDMDMDPPKLFWYRSDPPVYAPNGGVYYKGKVYWGAAGSVAAGSLGNGNIEQRPSILALDPTTNRTTTLLNNYYGWYFNNINDMDVDSRGDIWFTDPNYGWYNGISETAPQLKAASYRFRPSTGQVTIVDESMGEPRGIAISPDGKHVYISDTSAVSGSTDARYPDQKMSFNMTKERTVYKFDVVDNGNAITGKRPIWRSPDGIPDGLKVAANGYVLTASGGGVDVLDEYGSLILRVQAGLPVQNFVFAGPNLDELWITGSGGISRVKWNLRGSTPYGYSGKKSNRTDPKR